MGERVMEWFKTHSTVIFLVVIGVVGGVAFLKKNNASNSDMAPVSSMDTTGLQTDSNGVPIIYRDVADTFINIAIGSVTPNDTQPVASAPPPPSSSHTEHPIEPPPPSSSHSSGSSSGTTTIKIATIRQRVGTSGDPRGVPIRSGTNGTASITGWQAYGSKTVINSGPVNGGNNNPVSGGSGSTQWYSVPGGYLSAYDVSGISTQTTNSSSTTTQGNSQTTVVRNNQ